MTRKEAHRRWFDNFLRRFDPTIPPAHRALAEMLCDYYHQVYIAMGPAH